jgi:serine/threonine protein kinase
MSARLDHPHILTLIDSGNADGFLYYVLPYVRGESLRSKLDREHQLGIDEAIAIAKQVASALDYAHRQGLVHRDIKPENILIQEGEAMLTDFGIALAVKEAGGNRLTQTGLSLGTPQYMSPEQATGDRTVDARSDVYSLAAVFYEMVGGEPPVSGRSAQSMIAKLMTEKPTHLRVLRETVSDEMDEAVAKALSKTPADRFSSAGDFVRALGSGSRTPFSYPAASRRKRIFLYSAAAVGVLALAAGTVAIRKKTASAHAVLGERTQLTSSGAIRYPAISGDGKQLAYITRKCNAGQCLYGIAVQDIGGSNTRSIFEGASRVLPNHLQWSPDRRNVLFHGTVGDRSGMWLISVLGAPPIFLTPGAAAFTADGDSLLIGPPARPDSLYWIRVTSLAGVVHDSVKVVGPGQGVAIISAVPGKNWILTLVVQPPHGLWQVVSRDGKVLDRVVNTCLCGGVATTDAVWLARAGSGLGEAVVRIALDGNTGRLSAQQDTMTAGLFTAFSVTADGGAMVMDEGVYDYNAWALDFGDLMKGNFPENRRIIHASTAAYPQISPDGERVLIRRVVPRGGERAERRYTVVPFLGGQETEVPASGNPIFAKWVDSVTVALKTQRAGALSYTLVDVRNGAQRRTIQIPDSIVTDFAALRNGWVWVPVGAQSVVLNVAGKSTTYPKPAGLFRILGVFADEARDGIFMLGSTSNRDFLILYRLDLRDGSITEWGKLRSGSADVTVLDDGSILITLAETANTRTLFLFRGPGIPKKLGVVPRPVDNVSVSSDLKRAIALFVDYHADAWMSKVVPAK